MKLASGIQDEWINGFDNLGRRRGGKAAAAWPPLGLCIGLLNCFVLTKGRETLTSCGHNGVVSRVSKGRN